MLYKEGDKPKVRRHKDMLCEFYTRNFGERIEIYPGFNQPYFVDGMVKFCGEHIEISYIPEGVDNQYVAHGWYWIDDFFERGEADV